MSPDAGATAITLRASGVAVTVDPARGARITHLRNLEDGREWLHQAGTGSPTSSAYDDGSLGGWDEMMPTIAACRQPDTGEELSDHGDLWDQAWEVVAHDDASLTTRATTRRPVVTLERTVRVLEHRVRLDYAATSPRDTTVLWAAHPLFALRSGSRVVLDETLRPVRGDAADRPPFAWPRGGLRVDADLRPGSDVKLFTDVSRTTGPPCGIVDADGSRLDLTWEVAEAPVLGIWLDHGSLVEGSVVALEPTTGADDALDEASRRGPAWALLAERPRRWWVEVALAASASTRASER